MKPLSDTAKLKEREQWLVESVLKASLMDTNAHFVTELLAQEMLTRIAHKESANISLLQFQHLMLLKGKFHTRPYNI